MRKMILILLLTFSSLSHADEVFDFQVNGDNWRVGVDRISEILYLAKYDAVEQRYKWKLNPDYSYNPDNLTAEQYFADFIENANARLVQEYGQGEYPTGFGDILEYLVKHKVAYENGELIVTN